MTPSPSPRRTPHRPAPPRAAALPAAAALLLVLLIGPPARSQAQPSPAAPPLAGLKVCLDPGHGGPASAGGGAADGWIGPGGTREADVALDIARLLAERLRRSGAEVILTRTADRRLTPATAGADEELAARIALAERERANYFLSIQVSFSRNPEVNATQAFYHPERDTLERRLAESLVAAVVQAAGTTSIGAVARPQRLIAEARIPAVIIEVSSLSNPAEERRLATLSYCRTLADALHDGFVAFRSRRADEASEGIAARGAEPAPAPTPTPTPTPTATPLATPAPTPTPRPTPRPTPAATQRPAPRATPTPRATAAPPRAALTPSPTPTPARTPRPTAPPPRATPTPRPTVRPTATPKPRATPTPRPVAPTPTSTPRPVAPTPTPATTPAEAPAVRFLPIAPVLLAPVEGPIDQSWLFGEQYATLPLQRGVSFAVPEGSLVVAAADAVVDSVVRPEAAPGRPASEAGGIVVLRHDALRLRDDAEPSRAWTLYARLGEVYLAPGERVAAGEPVGRTLAPYDGRPETRRTAFQFELRVGENSPVRALNPEPFLRAARPGDGILALRVRDRYGLPLSGVELRGAAKDPRDFPRYAYSLTYPRGVAGVPFLGENALIGGLRPGTVRLVAGGEERAFEVRGGMITLADWVLPGAER